jgi:U5 snRNP spliceosome subunit
MPCSFVSTCSLGCGLGPPPPPGRRPPGRPPPGLPPGLPPPGRPPPGRPPPPPPGRPANSAPFTTLATAAAPAAAPEDTDQPRASNGSRKQHTLLAHPCLTPLNRSRRGRRTALPRETTLDGNNSAAAPGRVRVPAHSGDRHRMCEVRAGENRRCAPPSPLSYTGPAGRPPRRAVIPAAALRTIINYTKSACFSPHTPLPHRQAPGREVRGAAYTGASSSAARIRAKTSSSGPSAAISRSRPRSR